MRFTEQTIIVTRHNWRYDCTVTSYAADTSISNPEGGYTAEAEFGVVSISPETIEHTGLPIDTPVDDLISAAELEHLIIGKLIDLGYN